MGALWDAEIGDSQIQTQPASLAILCLRIQNKVLNMYHSVEALGLISSRTTRTTTTEHRQLKFHSDIVSFSMLRPRHSPARSILQRKRMHTSVHSSKTNR